MARIEWTTGALDTSARAELIQALRNDLKWASEAQVIAFADAASEAVDDYRKLFIPHVEDRGLLSTQLENLKTGATLFAKAARKLNPHTRDMLEMGLFMAARRANAPPDDAPQIAANGLTQLDAATKIASTFASLAEDIKCQQAKKDARTQRRNRPASSKDQSAVDLALELLVGDLVRAYASIFKEQPSPAAEGAFSKALRMVFTAAGLKAEIGEKRLRRIIDDQPMPPSAKPARRGPKARTDT